MEDRWLNESVESLAKMVRNRLELSKKHEARCSVNPTEGDRIERLIWVGHAQAMEAVLPYVEVLEREWAELRKEMR
jgi:hypothetical protein